MSKDKLDKEMVKRLDQLKTIGRKATLHSFDGEAYKDKVELSKAKLETEKEKYIQSAMKEGFTREAADMSFTIAPSVDRVPLLYMDPLFDPVLMLFPKDNIRELNRRLRHYYQYNPYIRNIIDLHSEFPLSDFDFKCVDPAITKYFNEFKERKELLETLVMISKDHWLLGEGFLYGNWNDYDKEFESFNQYPPEDVEVRPTYVSSFVYFIKPNENIKKQLRSSDPIDKKIIELMEQEMPEFVEKMKSGKNYMFDNKRLIHLARRPNKYTPRGISPVLSVIKDLLYEDQLRMLLTTFVNRHAFPIKIFKIGSKEKGWIPPPSKYKEFEQHLIQASNDPDYNIITHPFVEVDYVVGRDKIMDLIPHFEFVAKRYMVGLFVNDAVVHGELGPYASQAISVRVLMNKYMTFRESLANKLTEKVLFLLCIARDFKLPKQADIDHRVRTTRSGYDIPKIFWHRMNLMNNRELMEFVGRLRENGEIPFKYIAELFDWDLDAIKQAFKEEQSTELDPLWRKVRDSKAGDEKIANQILDGTKVEKWTIKEKGESIVEKPVIFEPEKKMIHQPLSPLPPKPEVPKEEKEPVPPPAKGEGETPAI